MCGIFATNRADLWQLHMVAVLQLLRHRGPDASGLWTSAEGNVLLGHTRLSVIGLDESANQPALSSDAQVALTFNGEIYNYQERAADIGMRRATSDTRVLCELLRRRAIAGADGLRGMYAFAAWDEERRTLVAARDPWGIKPLYILSHPSGGVTLCSEIPTLLLSDDARYIDRVGLAHFLTYGHTGSSATLFENIRKVRPGVLMQWTKSPHGWEQRSRKIVTPKPVRGATFGEAIEDTVAAHLVADVEVGVFLSGGVDSTLLAAVATQQRERMRAYTIAFPDYLQLDESPLVAHNASMLGIASNIVPVTVGMMVQATQTVIRVHGEPVGDAAVLPLTCLASAAAADLKVVLTGEGADELYGSYGRYRVSRILDHASARVGRSLRAPAAAAWSRRRRDRPRDRAIEAILWGGGIASHGALLGSEAGWQSSAGLPWSADVVALAAAEWHAAGQNDSESARARTYDQQSWLPNVYLEKTDRATMSSSLEARVPYLDPCLVKIFDGHPDPSKEIARRELTRRLPGVQMPSRKKGLAVPLSGVLDGDLKSFGLAEVSSPRSLLGRTLGIRWQEELRQRSARSPSVLFRLAMLGLWEECFDGDRYS